MYMTIYTWQMLEGQVPDITSGKIYYINEGGRLGRKCSSPPINHNASPDVKRIRYASLAVKGPQLFNILPSEIRNLGNCSVEIFKRALDKFLDKVPDEPQIPGYTAMRRADSNSLVDMYLVT